MMHEDDQFGANELAKMRRSSLNRAATSYGAFISRLWAGNATGVVIVVGALSQAPDQTFPEIALTGLFSLASFLFGIFALSIGDLVEIVIFSRRAREVESVTSILSMKAGRSVRPTESFGLSLYAPRTISVFSSAILFLIGCSLGAISYFNFLLAKDQMLWNSICIVLTALLSWFLVIFLLVSFSWFIIGVKIIVNNYFHLENLVIVSNDPTRMKMAKMHKLLFVSMIIFWIIIFALFAYSGSYFLWLLCSFLFVVLLLILRLEPEWLWSTHDH